MANAFGGTITGKNEQHTNQASLLYVYVPRSTSVIKEVLTDVTATITGSGSISDYTNEGLLVFSNTSSVIIKATVSTLSIAGSVTAILCFKNTTSSGTANNYVDFQNSAAPYVEIGGFVDGYTTRFGEFATHTGSHGLTGAFGVNFPDAHYTAVAIRTQVGTQNCRWRSNSSLNGSGGITGTTADGVNAATDTLTDVNGLLNTLRAEFNSDNQWQYLLIYTAYLSNSDIDAIFADPGAVVSFEAGAGQPFGKRLGGVPFATSSRGVW